MVRTLPLDSESRPQLPRILAIATAIAVHAFALLLLLIPMAVPPMQQIIDKNPGIIFIPPKETPVVVPVTQRQETKPKPQTQPIERIEITPRPTISDQVIVDNGTVAVVPTTPDTGPVVEATPLGTGPISVGSLEYIKATPPPYPRVEARAGIQGTVVLKILVDVDGHPLTVEVLQSSGNRALDRSAREHVLKAWLFKPATQGGQPVQAYGKVPVVFSLQ